MQSSNALFYFLTTDSDTGNTSSRIWNLVVDTACIKMKMTTEEAINAAAFTGAYTMGLSETHGSITIGKKQT